jgi:hypothetical protein
MGKGFIKLSKNQEIILDYVNSGSYTVDDICKEGKWTRNYVNKVVRKLQKFGWDIKWENIGKTKNSRSPYKEYPVSPYNKKTAENNRLWRYHNLHFVITPYHKYPRYQQNIGITDVPHGDWLVSVHKDIVEVQLRQQHDIKDVERWQCIEMTRDNFNKKLAYVANLYGFEYEKDKKTAIVCVNGHLAQENSDVAETRQGTHLLLYGEDGRAWFEIDTSHVQEHEYRHPQQHVQDSEVLEKHFNALRNQRVPTLEEVWRLVSFLVKDRQEGNMIMKTLTQAMVAQTMSQKQLIETISLFVPKQDVVKEQQTVMERPAYIG